MDQQTDPGTEPIDTGTKQIEQPEIGMTSETEFKVTLLYKGHSLGTDSMPNGVKIEEVKAQMRKAIDYFESKMAVDNMTELKQLISEIKEV